MHAASVRQRDRCEMAKDEIFELWLKKPAIDDVEAFVPDIAGAARGMILTVEKFGAGEMKTQ